MYLHIISRQIKMKTLNCDSVASMASLPAKLRRNFIGVRTFVDARVKWVSDSYLDMVVEREKDLRPVLSFKHQILSSDSKTLTLSIASLLKPRLRISVSSEIFFNKHHSFFSVFQPGPGLPPRVRLTRRAMSLHAEEVISRAALRDDVADRLARVLMLAGANRAPIRVIEMLGWELGLGESLTSILADFPDYFQVCEFRPSSGESELALELVSRRKSLAASELERRRRIEAPEMEPDTIAFPMSFPRRFDLEKKVKVWVEQWQSLPYISPYENAFHLSPRGDQAEKWAVALLHELLWLTVSKKMEKQNILSFGKWLGFDAVWLKKVLVHHPGIFYISNKLRTQTVVLREAYRKDLLLEKHPIMAMRYQYIRLLNSSVRSRAGNTHTC